MKKYLAALLAAGTLVTGTACASAMPASASKVPVTTLCGHNAHVLVHDPDHRNSYIFRTPTVHDSKGEFCARNVGGGTNLQIVQTATPNGTVTAYPALMAGCYWNACTPDMRLPAKISSLHHLRSTWITSGGLTVPGTYNTSYDIWIGKHRQTQGHADGAELMIWLNHHGGCCQVGTHSYVKLGVHRYMFQHWVTTERNRDSEYFGKTWQYLQFRMTDQRTAVHGINLLRIVQYAEKCGIIRPNWWIENVQGGNEIWSGGVGLRTEKYRVTAW